MVKTLAPSPEKQEQQLHPLLENLLEKEIEFLLRGDFSEDLQRLKSRSSEMGNCISWPVQITESGLKYRGSGAKHQDEALLEKFAGKYYDALIVYRENDIPMLSLFIFPDCVCIVAVEGECAKPQDVFEQLRRSEYPCAEIRGLLERIIEWVKGR